MVAKKALIVRFKLDLKIVMSNLVKIHLSYITPILYMLQLDKIKHEEKNNSLSLVVSGFCGSMGTVWCTLPDALIRVLTFIHCMLLPANYLHLSGCIVQ
jgi:hypothetical protein